MTTRDSGMIDLFAIHNHAEASVTAPPSAPPPAVSFDTGAGEDDIDDDEIDALALAGQKSRKRAKMIGGAIGATAVLGILIAAVAAGPSKAPEKPTAAAAPPPVVQTTPAPPAVEPAPPPPAPVPPPPATAKAKADYTPATAAAAYAASQPHAKKKASGKSAKSGGVKLQKVQSSGTGS